MRPPLSLSQNVLRNKRDAWNDAKRDCGRRAICYDQLKCGVEIEKKEEKKEEREREKIRLLLFSANNDKRIITMRNNLPLQQVVANDNARSMLVLCCRWQQLFSDRDGEAAKKTAEKECKSCGGSTSGYSNFQSHPPAAPIGRTANARF